MRIHQRLPVPARSHSPMGSTAIPIPAYVSGKRSRVEAAIPPISSRARSTLTPSPSRATVRRK